EICWRTAGVVVHPRVRAAPVRRWARGGTFMAIKVTVAVLVSAAGSAWGQCTPQWDTSAGHVGISGGYAGPVRGWNDGLGEELVAASLGMWNGTAWEAMGTTWTGSTRGSIWSLAVWNGLLYAGGGVVNQPPVLAGRVWAGLDSWDGLNWTPIVTSIVGFSP